MRNIAFCIYGDIIAQYEIIFKKIQTIMNSTGCNIDIFLLVDGVHTHNDNIFQEINDMLNGKIVCYTQENIGNGANEECEKNKHLSPDTDIARLNGNFNFFYKMNRAGNQFNTYLQQHNISEDHYDLICLFSSDIYFYNAINSDVLRKGIYPNIMYSLDKLPTDNIYECCQHLIIANYKVMNNIFNMYDCMLTSLGDIYGPEDKIKSIFKKSSEQFNITKYSNDVDKLDAWGTFARIDNNLFYRFYNHGDSLLYNNGWNNYRHDVIVYNPENIECESPDEFFNTISEQLYNGYKILLHVYDNEHIHQDNITNAQHSITYGNLPNSEAKKIIKLWYVVNEFSEVESNKLFENKNWLDLYDKYFSYEHRYQGIRNSYGKYYTGISEPTEEIEIDDISYDTIIEIMNPFCLVNFSNEYERSQPRIAWEYFVTGKDSKIMTSQQNIIDINEHKIIYYEQDDRIKSSLYIKINNKLEELPSKYINNANSLLHFMDHSLARYSTHIKNDAFYGNYNENYLVTKKHFIMTPNAHCLTSKSICMFPENGVGVNLSTNTEQNYLSYAKIWPFQIENNGTAAICTKQYKRFLKKNDIRTLNVFNTYNQTDYFFGDTDNFWKKLTVYIPSYMLDLVHDEWLLKSLSYQVDKNFTVLFIDPYCSQQRQDICKKMSKKYNMNIMWYPRKPIDNISLGCRDYIHINDVCLISKSEKIVSWGQCRLYSSRITEVCNNSPHNIVFKRYNYVTDFDMERKIAKETFFNKFNNLTVPDTECETAEEKFGEIKLNNECCNIDDEYYKNNFNNDNIFDRTFIASFNNSKTILNVTHSGDTCMYISDLINMNGVDEIFMSAYYSEDCNRSNRSSIITGYMHAIIEQYEKSSDFDSSFKKLLDHVKKNKMKNSKQYHDWKHYDGMVVYINKRYLPNIFKGVALFAPEITIFPFLGLYKKSKCTDILTNSCRSDILSYIDNDAQYSNKYMQIIKNNCKINNTEHNNMDIKHATKFIKNTHIKVPSLFNIFYSKLDTCIICQNVLEMYNGHLIFPFNDVPYDFELHRDILFRDEFVRQLITNGEANKCVMNQGRDIQLLKTKISKVPNNDTVNFIEETFYI
jgi:hypothetical protein